MQQTNEYWTLFHRHLCKIEGNNVHSEDWAFSIITKKWCKKGLKLRNLGKFPLNKVSEHQQYVVIIFWSGTLWEYYHEIYLKEPAVSARSSHSSLRLASSRDDQWPGQCTQPAWSVICITLTCAAPRAPGVSGHNSSSEIGGKMISLWLSLQILYFGYKALETVNSLKLDLWSWFLVYIAYVCSLFFFRAVQRWQSHRDHDYSTTSLTSLDYGSIFWWINRSFRADQRWLSRMDLGHDTTKTWWW